APCFRHGKCKDVQVQPTWDLTYYVLDFYQYLHAQMLNLGEAPPDGRFILAEDEESASYEDWRTWSETVKSGFESIHFMCDALKQGMDSYGDMFISAIAARGWCPL